MKVVIETVRLAETFPTELQEIVRRSPVPDASIRTAAAEIVRSIRDHGDSALRKANLDYGGGRLGRSMIIDEGEIQAALAELDSDLVESLRIAADNIRRCHEPQRPVDSSLEVVPGVTVERRWSPLERVGVYVPGGQAAYPSSLLMGVIPAQVAGVPSIAVTSPAGRDGEVSQIFLAACALLGVTEVYTAGGAQAIGALAYGTETIAAVDKIVGPGNAWVTAAKLAVFGDVAVDLPAGPSEALVVIDASASPRIVAADLLCQAEHGPDSPVVLVTEDESLISPIIAEIEQILPGLEREGILRAALADHGLIVIAPDHDSALQFANDFAPEHLGLHTVDALADAAMVPAAGSVFVGPWTPESAGDYATGANHVLPTGGLARSYGPLSVEDYGSWRQVQEVTREGLIGLRPTITRLANAEGLTAHAFCVDVRFENEE